jgi:hypothetical protein
MTHTTLTIEETITRLASTLGTADGLAQVNAVVTSLRLQLVDSKETFARAQLVRIKVALETLSGAILAMDRVARALLGQSMGAVDYVG